MPRRPACQAFALGLCAALVLLAGCGDATSRGQAAAEKIKPGMTEGEVEAILGKPGDTREDRVPDPRSDTDPSLPLVKARQATWKQGRHAITVTFVDGKVVTCISGEGG